MNDEEFLIVRPKAKSSNWDSKVRDEKERKKLLTSMGELEKRFFEEHSGLNWSSIKLYQAEISRFEYPQKNGFMNSFRTLVNQCIDIDKHDVNDKFRWWVFFAKYKLNYDGDKSC